MNATDLTANQLRVLRLVQQGEPWDGAHHRSASRVNGRRRTLHSLKMLRLIVWEPGRNERIELTEHGQSILSFPLLSIFP